MRILLSILQDFGARIVFLITILVWFQIWNFFHPHQSMPMEILAGVYLFSAYGFYLLTKPWEDQMREDVAKLLFVCFFGFWWMIWDLSHPSQAMPTPVLIGILLFSIFGASLSVRNQSYPRGSHYYRQPPRTNERLRH